MTPVAISAKRRAYLNAYQNARIKRLREEWFAKNGPCVKCGSSKDLQVDHVDSTKKVTHRVWSWSKIRREAELAKCQVLCAECHRDKSRLEAARGIDASDHKLTNALVREIRRAYLAGEATQEELAEDAGVHKTTVSRAIRGVNWKHIT